MFDNAFENSKYKKVHAVDRFMAKGLDMIVLVALTLILALISYPLAAIFAIAYALFHDAIKGGSPGKRIVGLRVLRHPDEELAVDWKASAMRNVSFALFTLFALVPMAGWILMFFVGIPLLIFEAYLIYSLDSGYRLGDILAKTRVVSQENYSEKQESGEE